MTETFSCGDGEALVSYLYDEGSPKEREVIAAHIAACGSCARELASLGTTRRQLAAWTPPPALFGYRVAREAESRSTPQVWWRQPLPAWMQVAAAAVLFAGGLVIGTSRGASENPVQVGGSAVDAQASSTPVTASVSPSDLTELEERLRAEMKQLRGAGPVTVAAQSKDAQPNEAVLTQVRALIAESEERQRRELALRTVQIMRDLDNQRRVDLTQVQRTWDQVQGLTGAEVQQQRQILNELARRVSLQR